jgi:hypothetical protein
VSLTVKVLGLKDVEQFLARELPGKMGARTIARGLRLAAKPMRDAARANAAGLGGSGALALATTVWSARPTKGGNTVASVEIGPRRNSKAALVRYYAYYGKKPTPRMLRNGIRHGHLVEWGAKRTAPRRFMQRAFDATVHDSVAIFQRDIGALAERTARAFHARQGNGDSPETFRIYPSRVPQGEDRPAIRYERVSTVRPQGLDGPSAFFTTRFQIDCWAETDATVRALSDAVVAALDGHRGTFGSATIQAAYIETTGGLPEFDPEDTARRVTMDLVIMASD